MEDIEVLKKVCPVCKINKPKSEYHLRSARPSGVQSKCKECLANYKKERYWKDRDRVLKMAKVLRDKPEYKLRNKEYYIENKDKYIERYNKYQADESKREYRLQKSRKKYNDNIEKYRVDHKIHSQKEETKEKRRIRHNERKETDINYLIKRRLRFRLRHIIKALGNDRYKRMSSIDLLGCDMEFFRNYIDSKFNDGMSWDRISEIHIDHIKPCSKFDLTKLDEQKKCFHYTNLQPLWALDNIRKNAKYEEQKIA